MITASTAITSQYYPTQLWSAPLTDQQQRLVCDNAVRLLNRPLSVNNPNIVWCNQEASTIGINQIRQLQTQLSFRSGELRFVFILFAERLTIQAQNALLKLLEEPPANTQIVLVSNKPHMLLPTIRSRCSESRLQTDEKDAKLDRLEQLYANWKQLTISEAIQTAATYKKRDLAIPILQSLVIYLRDKLKTIGDSNAKQLQIILTDSKYFLQALEQLRHNTNCQLVMEALFFRLNKHSGG